VELAADIDRFLNQQPVLAHPPSLAYRASKFVRRHRVGTATVTTVVLALLAGATTTALQAIRATRAERRAMHRFDQVRDLTNSLIFDVHDQIFDLTGATGAREFIVSRAMEYLESLGADAGDDLDLLEELESGWVRLANIQGTGSANLGDLEDARQSYAKSLELIERLLRADPSSPDYRLRLAGNLYSQAYILVREAHHEEAAAMLKRPLDVCTTLVAENPANRSARALLGDIHGVLGDIDHLQGRLDSAVTHARSQIETYDRLLAGDPENLGPLGELAGAHITLVERLWNAGELEPALDHGRQAHEVALQLTRLRPENVNFRSRRVITLALLSRVLLARGEHEQGLTTVEEALALGRELADADPDNAETQNIVSKILDPLVGLLFQYGSNSTRAPSERLYLLRACERFCEQRAGVFGELQERGTVTPNEQVRGLGVELYCDRCRVGLEQMETGDSASRGD
jgi:tetratricopeptide (TPR) repeat protein